MINKQNEDTVVKDESKCNKDINSTSEVIIISDNSDDEFSNISLKQSNSNLTLSSFPSISKSTSGNVILNKHGKLKIETKSSYFSSKTTKIKEMTTHCPICNLKFEFINSIEFRESHINNCLNQSNFNVISTKKTSSLKSEINFKKELIRKNEMDSKLNLKKIKIEDDNLKPISQNKVKIDNNVQIKVIKEEKKIIITSSNESIITSHNNIKLTNDLNDQELLITLGSLIHNPTQPIYYTTPDIFHNAKSKIKRPLPDSKKIPGTTFSLDAFNVGAIPLCQAYFLSHFHSDHYGGIGKTFSHAWIFCSKITANLLNSKIGVNMEYIKPLELNTLYIIDNVRVILIDANHCPGSVLFLFEVPYDDNIDHSNPNKFTRILHCGDFRVHKDIHLNENSILSKIPLDYLYLDTTYCNPSYSFPSQKQVIDKSIILANEFISLSSTTDKLKNSIFNYFSSTSKPKKNIERIIAVGSYSIGKERIFLNIAKQLKTKVYVTQAKFQILMNFMDINLNNILTLDPTEAKVHILPMNQINAKSLKEYFEQIKLINPNLNSILGIKPTGWTFSNKYANQDNPPSKIDLNNLKPSSICDKVTIYGLPYSEHSSFEELRSFVKHIAKVSKNNNKNLKVIPTVKPANMDPLEVLEYLNEWAK